MASVFMYHVVGDLTVAKPEMVEFEETETVESAIRAIGESTENGIPVWKRKSQKANATENSEMRHQRFVGILKSIDIVSFFARDRCFEDREKAMKTPVSEILVPNNTLLREVDSTTRLMDALEMMKQGVERLLVPKGVPWRGVSKKFTILYNGKGLKNTDSSTSSPAPSSTSSLGSPSTSWTSSSSGGSTTISQAKFCCLSREDVIRFLIDCLGSLAPVPLTSISTLGAINPHYSCIEASSLAVKTAEMQPPNPTTVAVVETTSEGRHRLIGEISASKLWKCDYLATAYALASLSAGQFVMGVEENLMPRSGDDMEATSPAEDNNTNMDGSGSTRPRKFSSRSMGFFSNSVSQSCGRVRITYTYRGRSAPLTCNATSSLAAVMAQMLSHRSTHVWVTEGEHEDMLVGVISYEDIVYAVTRPPPLVMSYH